MQRSAVFAAAAALLGAVSAASVPARAQPETDWSLQVQNDMRFDVARAWEAVPDEADGIGTQVVEGDPRFSRNESSARLSIGVGPNEHIRLVGDIELVWLNYIDSAINLAGLTSRSSMDPWRVECDAAYVDLLDVLPGLDIRLGRQIVQWGSADMFNPTDNLNPDDLEDPLLFGENIANEMIRLSYSYIPETQGLFGELVLQLVWVPVFRPAQVPPTAVLVLSDNSSEIPVVEPSVRRRIEELRGMVIHQLDDPNVSPAFPELAIENSQVGARLQLRISDVDFAVSYYRGFDDLPVFSRTDSVVHTEDPENPYIESNVTLRYPRMQVLGFDINGQIEALDDLGFWVEGAVVWPERLPLTFVFPALPPIMPEPTVVEGTAVESRPFLKLTVGLDYSFNEYVFLNAQYVRGFIDEFGAGNLGNYLVAGLDLKFWSQRILLRLFGVIQLDFMDEDLSWHAMRDEISGLIFPMLRINPWGGLELDLGGFIPLGTRDSKFGQIATGSTTVFLRARASF